MRIYASHAMFAGFAGTWLPLLLAWVAIAIVGLIVEPAPREGHHGLPGHGHGHGQPA